MTSSQPSTSVLIVGAGPSGLMMAAQLLRYGIQPVIIDKRQGPTNHTKALAVQARTMEIYRQMGLAEKALQHGIPAGGLTFNNNGRALAHLPFAEIGRGQTPYPYILFYPQSKNERLLLDELTRLCCAVYWGTSLIDIQQHTDSVTATLQGPAGERTLNCQWVVGTDSAHSTIRKACDIAFNGDSYAQSFYLADAVLADELPADEAQIFMNKRDLAAFFPLPQPGRFRIIGNIPASVGEHEELKVDDILPSLSQLMGKPVDIVETHWFTVYKLHHRMAAKLRAQRCFLVGDAAHIHSPLGGQGMNTGLQDAYNLAWKLAGVINGHLDERILDSYEAERLPVAKQLLNTTDRLFKMITSTNWAAVLFKTTLLPAMLRRLWKIESVRQFFFQTVSQTAINYRNSNINLHLSQQDKIRAGDRLPYVEIYDERSQQTTDLHAWCSKPGFTLLVLGKFKEIDIFTLAKWITQQYNGLINLYYLPPSKRNAHVFQLFSIGPEQKKALIIRPDMHIGYINDVVDIDMMDNYLQNVAQVIIH